MKKNINAYPPTTIVNLILYLASPEYCKITPFSLVLYSLMSKANDIVHKMNNLMCKENNIE